MNFGDVALATTTAPVAVQFTNIGGASTGTLVVSVPGSNFSVASSNCSVLAPGASCTVAFRFSAQSLGSYSATATVGDGSSLAPVSLSATAVAAAVSCSVVTSGTATPLSATSSAAQAPTVGAHRPRIHVRNHLAQPLVTPGQPSNTPGAYLPADVRSAYGLPAIPGSWAGLTPSQLASFGAGQTVYIIDAGSSPANVLNDLNSFSAAYGLPGCASVAPQVPMPAPGASCNFVLAYNNNAGQLTATVPAQASGWALEIALDVEWAHAMAPLAQIVLIESPTNNDTLYAGVTLANSMAGSLGGVVSMSWGATENGSRNGASSFFSPFFNTAGMTYVAATGDNEEAVGVPAAVPQVLGVGGTSLVYYASTGSRSEVVWNTPGSYGTGGGVSGYTPIPAYQQHSIQILL